ncbi:MAG: hypothetical protein GX443_05445 [Deltaproteobacteria bacterium]|nr:hypothetical protein [Deltaproteobacteria bacterium]
MEAAAVVYNTILHGAACAFLPYFRLLWKKDPEFLQGRTGSYMEKLDEGGRPRIWLHASSVGEVTGAVPVCVALRRRLPGALLFLSVGTPQGYAFARSQVDFAVRVLPFPFDLPFVVGKALEHVKPDLYVSFEGEYWPNLFRQLAGKGIPAVLLNGSLSNRSARWYRLLWPLFEPVFRRFKWLAMHSEADLRNMLTLGVPAERTLLVGSSKYAGLSAKVRPERPRFWRDLLGISEGACVIVGGSLRGDECIGILDVYRRVCEDALGVVGIFAPRHMHNIVRMADWLRNHGIPFGLLTEIEAGRRGGDVEVVLVDRIGPLFELYSIGDLIFCGGTLEPSVGGHNILEPAAWGKAVFYGPGIQGVLDEHRLLSSVQGSFLVSDYRELRDSWKHWVHRLPELCLYGERANEALRGLEGIVELQLDLIMDALGEERGGRTGTCHGKN